MSDNGLISRADAEEFSQAFGQIGSGWWRQVAWAQRQRIPDALGLSTEEWVDQYVGGHVRMSLPDRREAVAELTDEGMSTREIGEVLGVDHATVARDRQPVADATAALAIAAQPDEKSTQPVADATPAIEDTVVGREADAKQEVRRHRAMRDFMQAAEKTAALLPQMENIVEGVLELDAQRARDEAERARTTWERVNELLAGRSAIRRVK